MSWIIVLLGVISLLFGVMLILAPDWVIRCNESLNRLVARVDDQVLKNRIGVGISLLLTGIFLFLYAYFISRA